MDSLTFWALSDCPLPEIMDHLYIEDMELTNEGFEKKKFANIEVF